MFSFFSVFLSGVAGGGGYGALQAFFITGVVRNLSRELSVQRLNSEKSSIICSYWLNRLSRYTLSSGTTHGKDDPYKAKLLLSRFAFVFLAFLLGW